MAKIPKSSTKNSKSIADYIAANFKSENEKLRASFFWVASNISYDVANMENIEFSDTSEQKIDKTLNTRKGVCIHYAELFNAIVSQLGFESVIIEGYTKQFGKVAALSHAWCAVKSEGKWWLFDPTWGAGSVNNGVFTKKLNNFYFKTPPKAMLETHMPFDYLWQLSRYPISNAEFISGKVVANPAKLVFNFADEIEKLKQKTEEIKLFECISRVEANGVLTKLIKDYLENKKNELSGKRNNQAVEKLNLIVEESNAATAMFNDFIFYRNKKFKPTLPDDTIREMIAAPKAKVVKCQKELDAIGTLNDSNRATLTAFRKNLSELLLQIEEQEKFVNEYLSNGKLSRKSMFSKVTWFGLPVN
ncbi:transglutaminase domain-containing protein [Flavobacterium sp. LM5]|uniref:transglutaminase domain-containing protein n=1 Tax=Flavobacterium sp. LM5 TaxID=1938610 RepID=UPI00167028AA|nr:transglutaminase domain-containing protein [Flavobacterium sp. LM5]